MRCLTLGCLAHMVQFLRKVACAMVCLRGPARTYRVRVTLPCHRVLWSVTDGCHPHQYDVSSSVKTLIDPTPRIKSHQRRAQCVQVKATGRMVSASLQILHK